MAPKPHRKPTATTQPASSHDPSARAFTFAELLKRTKLESREAAWAKQLTKDANLTVREVLKTHGGYKRFGSNDICYLEASGCAANVELMALDHISSKAPREITPECTVLREIQNPTSAT